MSGYAITFSGEYHLGRCKFSARLNSIEGFEAIFMMTDVGAGGRIVYKGENQCLHCRPK